MLSLQATVTKLACLLLDTHLLYMYVTLSGPSHIDTCQRTPGPTRVNLRRNAVPANILEPERRSSKCRWPQVER